jgi:diguanylate cyclase (GGDEF)-like protein
MIQIQNIAYCDLLIFCVLINAVMFGFLHMQKSRHSHSTKLFQQLIVSVVAAGTFEALTWLLGVPGAAALRPFYYTGNALFFSINLLPTAMGLRYLDFIVALSKEKNRKRSFVYLIPVYMNVAFVIVNLFSDGFLYTVDSANVYHRGVGVYIGNVFTILFAGAAVFCFYRNKLMVTGRITQVILTLTLLPVAGTVLQMLFYGLSLGIPGFTLGIFVSFLLMEKNELLKDPLTMLNSRAQMENRLQYKLKSQEPFTAIMIDVNDFKQINDMYGHTVGDEVLKDVSRILLSSANFEDFVCRFGGDEFFVILESARDIGHSYIKRIDQILADYSLRKPYTAGLSYGAVYVSPSDSYEVEELLRAADQLMYRDKENRRQERK